jgi:hypothetical protein
VFSGSICSKFPRQFNPRAANVISILQIQPKLLRSSEEARQTKCSIRSDAAPFQNDVIDARRRNTKPLR